MGPIIIATIAPIITLSIIKRTTESVGGNNIKKPIMAINPPIIPPKIPHLNRPHLNRLLNLLKRICFILSKNRLTDKAEFAGESKQLQTITIILPNLIHKSRQKNLNS